jgi:hypothetical protein
VLCVRLRDYTYQIVIKDKTRPGGISFGTWPEALFGNGFRCARSAAFRQETWNNYLADDRNRVPRIGI